MQQSGVMLSSALYAVGFAWFSLEVLRIANRPTVNAADPWEVETGRRIALRNGSWLYRLFEPLILDLRLLPGLTLVGRGKEIERALQSGVCPVPWKADEYLGALALRGVLLALPSGLLLAPLFGPLMALMLSIGVAGGSLVWGSRKLIHTAQRRIGQLKRRLPFGVDLLALMMEAGGSFREALGTLVEESRGHPLGAEFGKLLRELEHGRPLNGAMQGLRERLHDEDINELAFAVQKAEELGAPLSGVFLSLADQMRIKQSQWAEKAAGQAQANITFPGLVIMVACLLIVVAPFVIEVLVHSPGMFG